MPTVSTVPSTPFRWHGRLAALLAGATAAAVCLLAPGMGMATTQCGTVSGIAGSGTAGDPYLVASRGDLEQIDD